MKTYKIWILADFVETLKKDPTHHPSFNSFIILHNFAESASAKIDVNKSFKKCLLDVFLELEFTYSVQLNHYTKEIFLSQFLIVHIVILVR
jgi:hypothetical protein